MSIQGNVAVMSDGGTHHGWVWNEKNMVYRQNKSGGNLVTGDVVIDDTTNAKGMTITTTPGNARILGIVPQVEAADGTVADQAIAANGWGYVQFTGDVAKVSVDGATAIGNFLIASATAKKAMPLAAWQTGVFGVATSASAGAGTVSARLLPSNGMPMVATAMLADAAVTSAKLNLTTAQTALSSDVTMSNPNQHYDGPSLSLAAGTWLIMGGVTVWDTSGGGRYTAKLWNGTIVKDSKEIAIGNTAVGAMSLRAIVTLATTETWKISVAGTISAGHILAAIADNGAGNNASTLLAIRIG